MDSTPFISVAIPLYNKENYIIKTLESVAQQDFKNFEIVVINDGSTDESFKQVNYFFNKNKNIKHTVVSQENKGLSATRNEASKYAKGRYIAFLDADDIWSSKFLEDIYNMIQQFSENKVFATDYEQYYAKNKAISPHKNIDKSLRNNQFIVEDFFESSSFQPILIPSSFAIEKTTFINTLFDIKVTYSEDVDFFVRLFSSEKLVYSFKPLVYKNDHITGQITQLKLNNKTIPDFNWYEDNISMTPSLKKYINRYRYAFASLYKQQGDFHNYKKLRAKIDFEGLNWKQKLLLKLPAFFTNPFIKLKKILLKKGIRITTH